MKAKIISKNKNPFLDREEVIIEVEEKVTPSKEEVKEFLGGDKDKIIVKKIDANFGRHSFIANAIVYNTTEAKERVEVTPRKIRKKIAEEKKKALEAKKAQATKTEGSQ